MKINSANWLSESESRSGSTVALGHPFRCVIYRIDLVGRDDRYDSLIVNCRTALPKEWIDACTSSTMRIFGGQFSSERGMGFICKVIQKAERFVESMEK